MFFFNKSKSDKFIHNDFFPALLMPEDTTLPNASHLPPPPVERHQSLVQLLLPCVATPLHPHVGQLHPHVGQLQGLRQGSSSVLQTAVKESPTTEKITIWSGWTFLVNIGKWFWWMLQFHWWPIHEKTYACRAWLSIRSSLFSNAIVPVSQKTHIVYHFPYKTSPKAQRAHPRVELISQLLTQILIKFHFQDSTKASINFEISTKHQHFNLTYKFIPNCCQHISQHQNQQQQQPQQLLS